MPPAIVTSRDELRKVLAGTRPGLVPTMGALHAGHLELIDCSARENDETVVSIFVNPAQFGSQTDLVDYPRDLDRDASLAAEAGATMIFAPAVDAIYPQGFDTWVDAGDLARPWEGASRPGHFRGVATIVTILLNLVQPERSYFGEKDYQQLQVIRRLHQDLALPGLIVGCETVRDRDGLALSSRNTRLTPGDRERARAIPRAISAIVTALAGGEDDVQALLTIGRAIFEHEGITVDYLAIVDETELSPLLSVVEGARLLISAEIGGVRLIDNAKIGPSIFSAQ